jgi:peptidoglycan/xylan/chitin deacetylase (PgdA/CDA1 family)
MMRKAIGLIFHGIGTPGRTLEPGEAPYWITTERFEQVLDAITALPDPGRIHITFDDGNRSDHDIALPRLQERGLKADVFALSGRIGQAGSLEMSHLKDLARAGFGIGSHGIAHRDWRRISRDELTSEVARSRQHLSALIDLPVTEAAIPFGSYNAVVLRAIRDAGYTVAWTSDRGWFDPSAFLRPRTSIRSDTSDADLAMILSGRLSATNRARRALGMARRRYFGA